MRYVSVPIMRKPILIGLVINLEKYEPIELRTPLILSILIDHPFRSEL